MMLPQLSELDSRHPLPLSNHLQTRNSHTNNISSESHCCTPSRFVSSLFIHIDPNLVYQSTSVIHHLSSIERSVLFDGKSSSYALLIISLQHIHRYSIFPHLLMLTQLPTGLLTLMPCFANSDKMEKLRETSGHILLKNTHKYETSGKLCGKRFTLKRCYIVVLGAMLYTVEWFSFIPYATTNSECLLKDENNRGYVEFSKYPISQTI